MGRYIDVDEIRKRYKEPYLDADLDTVPSADVIEHKRGEWKNYKDEHYCTNCGEVVIGDWYDEDDWYDFCPNCGARIKGADDE